MYIGNKAVGLDGKPNNNIEQKEKEEENKKEAALL